MQIVRYRTIVKFKQSAFPPAVFSQRFPRVIVLRRGLTALLAASKTLPKEVCFFEGSLLRGLGSSSHWSLIVHIVSGLELLVSGHLGDSFLVVGHIDGEIALHNVVDVFVFCSFQFLCVIVNLQLIPM